MNTIAQDTLKLARSLISRDLVKIFDSLKKGQKIKVSFTSVMGMGDRSDGYYYEWIVGRYGG